MKYEMIFGDERLFDGYYDENVFIVIATSDGRKFVIGEFTEYGIVDCDIKSDGLRIAMRRVIRTPTWTVEDQKAGRLPPAGSKYLVGMHNIELECLYNDSKGNAWGFDAQGEVYGFAIKYCSPIETPEEKAERLRNEWINEAINAVGKTDVNGYESIYDALLSGALSVPTKGGE